MGLHRFRRAVLVGYCSTSASYELELDTQTTGSAWAVRQQLCIGQMQAVDYWFGVYPPA